MQSPVFIQTIFHLSVLERWGSTGKGGGWEQLPGRPLAGAEQWDCMCPLLCASLPSPLATCEPSCPGLQLRHVSGADGGDVPGLFLPLPSANHLLPDGSGCCGACARKGSWLPAGPWLFPDELGHSYVSEVQESELAGPSSPGTEPGEENSQPSRRKPWRDLRNSRITPSSCFPEPQPWAPRHLRSLGICIPPSLQHPQLQPFIPSLSCLLHKTPS